MLEYSAEPPRGDPDAWEFQNAVVRAYKMLAPAWRRLSDRATAMKCPKCRSTKLRWSRSRIWERPLEWLDIWPYRCRACRYRDYLFSSRLQLRVRICLRIPTLGRFAVKHPVSTD